MVALGEQHERLDRLRATVGAMQYQMDVAERELRTFTSRMLGDNVTLALLMLIAVGLVGIAVYSVSEIDARSLEPRERLWAGWWGRSHLISPLTE